MVVIIMGVTGSGKTTIGRMLADELGWAFYDADAFHPASNIAKMRQGIPLSDSNRLPWLNTLRALIQEQLREGEDAVLACSALKSAYRDLLRVDRRQIAFVYLKGSERMILKRLRGRVGHFMNPALLASQLAALEEPAEGIAIDLSLAPEAIVERIKKELSLKPRPR